MRAGDAAGRDISMSFRQAASYNDAPVDPNRPPMQPDPATARFKRRLATLAVIAAVGMAVLAGRVIWLQALQ